MTSSVTTTRARASALARWRPQDDPDLMDARAELTTAVLAQSIIKAITQTPLTVEQRRELAAVLLGGV